MSTYPRRIFLYGPPGSGKTTIGRILAENLDWQFFDLDAEIEAESGLPIPVIFQTEDEAGFRQREARQLARLLENERCVIALGGGAMTFSETRQLAEDNGLTVLLHAPYDILLGRLQHAARLDEADPQRSGARPLLSGDLPTRLHDLLERRSAHYADFPLHLDTSMLTPEQAAWQVQVLAGQFRILGMGSPYDVIVQPGSLEELGCALEERNLRGPLALVCDETIARLYLPKAQAALQSFGYAVTPVIIPPGEAYKNIQTVQKLWAGFLAGEVERGSTVIALGGGVAGDLTGFAAATFLRGVAWVNLPTTLLAMVDASLGGKTGADLPQGKNLIGAFHPPALVLADPQTLVSLPPEELRSGLAEVIKHAVIADPPLIELAVRAAAAPPDSPIWSELVRRAVAVKVQVIQADPYERGRRAALNLGHTVGHAVELVSGFSLRHGEAVAIGMVIEARLAEQMGIAQPGVAAAIQQALEQVGLPTQIPAGMDRRAILQAMQVDKKRAAGALRFALPARIGEVVTGVKISEFSWLEAA
jgi:3-dehydroquinate synthase